MTRIYSSIILFLQFIILFTSCSGDVADQKRNSEEGTEGVMVYEGDGNELSYEQQIIQNYQVYAMPIPAELSFAGEEVPLDNIIVKEALDKELHSNTYWHSNSFFYLKRANRWFPIIEKILEEHSIPKDFKYLAVIESGLMNVTSPSGAKGFWQFMKKTGEDYSLEISEDVDERMHLEKSTIAACEYLKSSFSQFENWTLAAASYNMGKAGIKGQLSKQKSDNYYDLLLNIETGRYVYRILAVKCIFENPIQYGFNFRKEDLYPPYKATSVKVDTSISNLAEFANSLGTNYKTLKTLNPWLITNKLNNKSGKTYEFLIPVEGAGLDMFGEYSSKYVEND